jgi:hypothetical protein
LISTGFPRAASEKITGRGCREFRQQDARRGRALSVYLDASIPVSLFTIDTLTRRCSSAGASALADGQRPRGCRIRVGDNTPGSDGNS